MHFVAKSSGIAALLAAIFVPSRLSAQETDARVWSGTIQANGSILFGNTEQRIVGGKITVARGDSVMELGAELQTLYGESSVEGQDPVVVKRLWLGALTFDWRPYAHLSPFLFGSVESNLEKRIAQRYSVGVGAKRTFVATDATEASLSVALLEEQTVPRAEAPDPSVVRLERWSLRGRARHAFTDRVRASHVTFWKPEVRAWDRYLIQSTSELIFQLTEALSFSILLVDNYDSEARTRGARVYNDGQLLFGVAAKW
ncbi:MAG TPA: DUF481 domain-containing protein [Gemmatimonadaceae bacterium]|nr:DUF481 domain-containing protein [Gemmatimonadaceae bacterium]